MNTSIILLSIVDLTTGMLSSSIGSGGGILPLPIVTSVYGVEAAIPIYTIAQLLSSASRMVVRQRSIEWKKILRLSPPSIPLAALGVYGFSIVPKSTMTITVGFALILFTIQKLHGKLHSPQHPATVIASGCVTEFINGMLSISRPLSSTVFLTLDSGPVSYIASEATAATVMHVVRIMVYGKLNLTNEHIIIADLGVAAAMVVGDYLAMRFIKNVGKKEYQKVVAGCMIPLSSFLIISTMC